LWECENGRYRFTHLPKKPRPITEFLRLMRKFDHLDEGEVQEVQALVNKRLATIRSLTEMSAREGGESP
jgi:pyruvate ferredoxin oxidoreductase beta subunit